MAAIIQQQLVPPYVSQLSHDYILYIATVLGNLLFE